MARRSASASSGVNFAASMASRIACSWKSGTPRFFSSTRRSSSGGPCSGAGAGYPRRATRAAPPGLRQWRSPARPSGFRAPRYAGAAPRDRYCGRTGARLASGIWGERRSWVSTICSVTRSVKPRVGPAGGGWYQAWRIDCSPVWAVRLPATPLGSRLSVPSADLQWRCPHLDRPSAGHCRNGRSGSFPADRRSRAKSDRI